MVHERADQSEKANEWRKKWFSSLRDRLGAEFVAYTVELGQMGLQLLQLKKWDRAEGLLRECLAIREKTQPDAWNTYYARSMLGEALLGQEKFAEAEPLLLKGFNGLQQRADQIPEGLKKTRLIEACNRIIELYSALANPEEQKKWQHIRDRLNDS